ncbi:hypothetical protein PR202_ga17821 [Eleusine coracana subsp. coracana]|uniref:Kinesin-like protein n=1 Tax=Eleusine coracana subsp. coracana TaxID=191504 RepID=A0AAV5CS15_ELECO|nr:hypothetical protein PR202_ga17821 [Eleusine coracana subsp. coracana]
MASRRHSDASPPAPGEASRESVTVTVRFRPLSQREIRLGEEIAWYADGDTTARSKQNHGVAYAYDRVFGPTATTRHVYDVAAQHVVSGAMEGINGKKFPLKLKVSYIAKIIDALQKQQFIPFVLQNIFYRTIFAYGVTSSGKTHTMHVVNDLLNPSGQNLRIREDVQGTFVMGIKEEVVLSPAHTLSLIAAGEVSFMQTIESSSCHASSEGEGVTFSQLNLIDLAGSESSRAETTGVRRKEGSYINKSLLTLGTVISKLTDGKAAHVPFRDSKLTRLLQSSLSGQGRVSLICTITPASSNSEETHNTLKFAHRAKHIEIQAVQNKIMNEKSLIKKYQYEICRLKEELDQLKRGILTSTSKDATEDNVIVWKQKLACLTHRRQDIVLDSERNHVYVPMEVFDETLEVSSKGEKKKNKGLLSWLKLRKHAGGSAALTSLNSDQSSPMKYVTAPSTPSTNIINCPSEQTILSSLLVEGVSVDLLSVDDEEIHFDKEAPWVNGKTIDHVDLLKEQLKILSGEVALHTSVLKRLTEETTRSTNELIEVIMEMKKVSDEIKGKKQQIAYLERHIKGALDHLDLQLSHAELLEQLNEKAFELQLKTADNRIIQDQLKQTATRSKELQGTVAQLKEQLSEALKANELLSESIILQSTDISYQVGSQMNTGNLASMDVSDELQKAQQSEINELNQRLHELTEAKNQLEVRYQKLLEESMYAKCLASTAGVKLKALSGEVTKLMNHNETLASELASARNSAQLRPRNGPKVASSSSKLLDSAIRRDIHASYGREQALEVMLMEKNQREVELQKKIEESKQKEAFLEGEIANMWVLVAKLKKAQGVEQDVIDTKFNGS